MRTLPSASAALASIGLFLGLAPVAEGQCPSGGHASEPLLSFTDFGNGNGSFSITNVSPTCTIQLSGLEIAASLAGWCQEGGPVLAHGGFLGFPVSTLAPNQSTSTTWNYGNLTPLVTDSAWYPSFAGWFAYAHYTVVLNDGSHAGQVFACTGFSFPAAATVAVGAPKPGSGGVTPTIVAQSLPIANQTFSFSVVGGLGGAAGVLFASTSPMATTTPIGTLLLVPQISIPIVLGGTSGMAGAGFASFSVFLPPSVPSPTFLQAWLLDPGATKQVTHTDALIVWVD